MTSPEYTVPHVAGWWAKKNSNLSIKANASLAMSASARLYPNLQIQPTQFGINANVELRGGNQAVTLDAWTNGNWSNGVWTSIVYTSWQHTVAAGENTYLIIAFNDFYNNEAWYRQNVKCQYDGTNMTLLAEKEITWQRALRVYGLANPNPGTHTCYVQVDSGTLGGRELACVSTSYKGVYRIGDVVTNSGKGTSLSSGSIYTLKHQKIAHAFGLFSDDSAYSDMRLGDKVVPGINATRVLLGDVDGTGSPKNVTANQQYNYEWASVGVPLWP